MKLPDSLFRWLIVFAALSIATLPAQAQNYTWNANATGNWSNTANWLGSVAPPTGGSVSTSLTFTNSATLIDVPATAYTATNDLSGTFQLNNLTINTSFGAYTTSNIYRGLSIGGSNPIQFINNGGTGPTITISGAATRIAVEMQLFNDTAVNGDGPGHLLLTGLIGGSGQLVINRTSGYSGITHVPGNQLGFYGGQTIINGNNTLFTGGVLLQGGNLAYSVTSAGNTPLGTGTITVNGSATNPASLRVDSFSTNALSNNIQLNSTLYFTGNNSGFLSGVISGPGSLVAAGLGLTLTNANTFTGQLVADGGPFRSSSGPITFSGNGSALNIAGAVIGPLNGITLDNSGTNNTNRLPDGLVITGTRGVFTLTGNASSTSNETVGRYVVTGFDTIAVANGTGQSASITFGGANPIERVNNGVLFVRGTAMGTATPGTAGTQNVMLTNSTNIVSSLIGNTASLNSTTALDVPILPWGVGHTAATGNPTRLLTYHSSFGFRPLPDSQYLASISDGTTTQNNVRLTGAATGISSSTTINALIIGNISGSGGTSGTGTLTLTSGTLLSAISGTGTTAAVGNLNFVTEARLTLFGNLTVNGQITGTSDGIVKAGFGVMILNDSAPLNVPGPFTILVGLVSSADPQAALGNVTELRLNGGGLRALNPGDSATFSKPIYVSNANGQITTGNASLGQTTDLTVNSVIADMPWSNSSVALTGQSAGSVQFGGSGTITLNATNTYSSNTILSASATVIISQEANFGTGQQIIMEGAATLRTTASFDMSKSLILNGGTGDMTLSPDAGTTLTWNGPIHQRSSATSAFPLTKAGTGTLVIASNQNTFTGRLIVNAGTLQITGSLAPLNSTGQNQFANENYGVNVNSSLTLAGTLAGTGNTQRVVFVDGGTGIGGTIAPGVNGSGTLTTFGTAIAAGGNFRTRITNGSTPAAVNSGLSTVGTLPNPTSSTFLFASVGTLTIDPLANIIIDGTGTSFTLGSPYSYVIASAGPSGNVTGVNITDPARFSTIGFDATNFSLVATGNVIYLNYTPVPEPGFLLVTATALLLLGGSRRRIASILRGQET